MPNIVIARYNENIEWINHLDEAYEVFVYNKGPSIDTSTISNKKVHWFEVKNVGRETDTYLGHIENHNFENNDFTIFSQGDPFTHSPQFLDIVNNPHQMNDLQPLSTQWITEENIPPQLLIFEERQDWKPGGLMIRRERFSLKTWAPISFFDKGAWNIGEEYKRRHYLPDGINIANHFFALIGLNEFSEKCRGAELGTFSYGAIFSVSNSRVNAFKKLIGPRISQMRLIACADKNYGYIYERLWLHFFGEDFIEFSF